MPVSVPPTPSPRKRPAPPPPREPSRGRMRGISLLPWWAWLLIAGASFFLLQGIHSQINPADEGAERWYTIVDFASVALLVLFTLAGAVTFMLGRGHDVHAASGAASGNSSASQRMTWGQFELLAVEAFRRRGFQITERGSSSDDGARNLQLARGRQMFIAHCKAWKQQSVDIAVIRELYSMVIVSKANGGIAVTTGSFTQEARTFAAGRQLQLIDGQTLREMLRDAEGNTTIMPTIIPTDVVNAPTAQH
ncbi:MAG: restriction endonuclease [Casimicrobium sp.]